MIGDQAAPAEPRYRCNECQRELSQEEAIEVTAEYFLEIPHYVPRPLGIGKRTHLCSSCAQKEHLYEH